MKPLWDHLWEHFVIRVSIYRTSQVSSSQEQLEIMQRNDRWPDEYDPDGGSRAGSRRNSCSMSRRNSVKKEKEVKKREASSCTGTPKKTTKIQNVDFVVTGKQILKKGDRANSLPGSYHRRPSAESITKQKRTFDSPKRTDRPANTSHSSKSRETSLEDDVSLDLSQVSDFEDTNSKYGIKQKFTALATSTPKVCPKNFQKPRSGSLQSQIYSQKVDSMRRSQKSFDNGKPSRDSMFSCSRDSLYKTSSSASPYNRCGTELDYSSVSPEYSGPSSADVSPRPHLGMAASESQDLHFSSCCASSWQDCSEMDNTKIEELRHSNGEWNNFWANYNNSIAKVPMKSYYDQCPTPYRTENIDLADFEFSDSSRIRSPENIKNLNSIIRNEGLHLTPRETQHIIKCAHILGNVLTKAIERRSKEKDENQDKIQEINREEAEKEIKKKQMTLNLKETVIPLDVKEEKRNETVTTQTDISLPNTRSAPKIFESILRQLSKTSIEESSKDDVKSEIK